jgi:hypothetical protein
MKSESDFWKFRVKKALSGLDPVRIEDKSGQGVPDVNCTLGDIELKWVAKQGRDNTIFLAGKLRKEQRAWLFRRWRSRGNAWCLIGVGGDHFILLNGEEAALHMGTDTTWSALQSRILPNQQLRTILITALKSRMHAILHHISLTE